MKKHKCKDCNNLTFGKYCQKCYLFKYNPSKNPLIAIKMGCKKEKHFNWKGGKPKCIDCDKELSRYKAKRCRQCSNKHDLRNLGNYFSVEQKRKLSLLLGGTGIPYEKRGYPFEFIKVRNKILERDSYICQLCFNYGNEVHHIDYNKENNIRNNLICLCRKCNMKVNKNREYWKEYFFSGVRI